MAWLFLLSNVLMCISNKLVSFALNTFVIKFSRKSQLTSIYAQTFIRLICEVPSHLLKRFFWLPGFKISTLCYHGARLRVNMTRNVQFIKGAWWRFVKTNCLFVRPNSLFVQFGIKKLFFFRTNNIYLHLIWPFQNHRNTESKNCTIKFH